VAGRWLAIGLKLAKIMLDSLASYSSLAMA